MEKKFRSVYQIGYWINKGLTHEEALYEIRSRRSACKEYYVRKFNCTEEEALQKLKERQSLGTKNRTKESFRVASPRCIEYWLKKNNSIDEARLKVSEAQATFSLQKCIDKHGVDVGTRIWQDRQIKWQKTLEDRGSHNNEYKSILHFKKLQKLYPDREDLWNYITERLVELNWAPICKTVDELREKISKDYAENPYLKFYSIPRAIKTLSKLQRKWLDDVDFKEFFKEYQVDGTMLSRRGYRKWVNGSLLRSSYEIDFYELLQTYNIESIIDKPYPNSNFRYDFYLPKYNRYIEIAPLMFKCSEEYRLKMTMKQKIFGCDILVKKSEFVPYIERLISESND